jgi:hypothetical protein
MTYAFTLTPEDKDKFRLLYVGFVAGGNAIHRNGETRSRDQRAKEAAILRQLKAMSVRTPNDMDPEMRVLNGGGKLVIDAKQLEVLKRYIEAAPFPTHESDVVDDLLDWISGAQPSE